MTSIDYNQIDPQADEQALALRARMTLEEKIGQMCQIHPPRMGSQETERRIGNGQVGSLLNLYGVTDVNHWQRIAVEKTRLGIPLLTGNDVIHGYRTIFPIPLAESCSWDAALVEEAARVAAEEASADGTNWVFAPMVDVARDARWGRIAEGSGEDPWLGAELAAARIRGFQKTNLESGHNIVACPKHFAAYGATIDGKDYNTVDISERTLRDIYLPPFKAAFDAGAGTVMSSFNEISGVPSSANHQLLTQILRMEWDFDGVVLSDWNSIGELIPHGVVTDLKEAGRVAALAGTDMDMISEAFHLHLTDLVRQGYVPEDLFDESVRRILRLKFQLGLFEHPYIDESLTGQIFLREEYRQTALEMARKSMVLLKNEDEVLPLRPDLRRVALIGPLADDHHHILGCWYRIGQDKDSESVLDGLQNFVSPETEIIHVPGCDLEGLEPPDFTDAITAAENADIVIVVLGEGEHMSGEAHSRVHLDLPGHQQALLEAVTATGQPVIVVLMSGRPLVIPWMAGNVNAVLAAWHGGIRTGQAVADILFGITNPSGRLTTSWPRAVGQVPIYYAHKNSGRPVSGEGAFQFDIMHYTSYIDEEDSPLYPFGYGLSYTAFEYSDLVVETPMVGIEDSVVISVDVTNTGEIAGDEVVQLYVRDLVASVTRPVKELKAFEKITLTPGERKTIRFEVPVQRLGFHGLDLKYTVESGNFNIWIGSNASEGLQGTFVVS